MQDFFSLFTDWDLISLYAPFFIFSPNEKCFLFYLKSFPLSRYSNFCNFFPYFPQFPDSKGQIKVE